MLVQKLRISESFSHYCSIAQSQMGLGRRTTMAYLITVNMPSAYTDANLLSGYCPCFLPPSKYAASKTLQMPSPKLCTHACCHDLLVALEF